MFLCNVYNRSYHLVKSNSKLLVTSINNQKRFIQQKTESIVNCNNNNNIKVDDQNHLKSFYKSPSFYSYFLKFLSDSHFKKNIPEELQFNYQQTLKEFEEIQEIIVEDSPDDELTKLAQNECKSLISKLVSLQDRILEHSCLDDRDVNGCTFEIRAGVGGKEASLFAKELYQLYLKFIAFNGWDIKFNKDDFEQVDIEDNTSLFSETIEVDGPGCYHLLRHEAGVHRVQRVPKTEKYGRLHTSTVSISVIPVRHNLVLVKDSDLKFEVKNSSGAGGQNVNRNLTCVRCIHLPTGLALECQETRFQYLNKEIAIRKMKTLLNQMEYERLEKKAREQKQSQIGIAARSDKIRTYNFPQNRITDHRLSGIGDGQNIHNIDSYMAGQECDKMLNIINKLQSIRHNELCRQLRSLIENNYEKQNNKISKK